MIKLRFIIVILLMLTGCASKRPIIKNVTLIDYYVVRCPKAPGYDGAWLIYPTDKEAKQYCDYWSLYLKNKRRSF